MKPILSCNHNLEPIKWYLHYLGNNWIVEGISFIAYILSEARVKYDLTSYLPDKKDII